MLKRVNNKDDLYLIELSGWSHDAKRDVFHVMLTGMSLHDRDMLDVPGGMHRSYDTGWFEVEPTEAINAIIGAASRMEEMITKDFYASNPLKSPSVMLVFDDRALFDYREKSMEKAKEASDD